MYPEDELAKRRARFAPKTSIPSQSDYELREAHMFQRQIREVERAPLSERKEGAKDFAEALRNPSLVAERISWLVDGNYGYGAMLAAKRVIANKHMNRESALVQMVAALDWRCPQRLAVAEWKKLSPKEKQALSRAVKSNL